MLISALVLQLAEYYNVPGPVIAIIFFQALLSGVYAYLARNINMLKDVLGPERFSAIPCRISGARWSVIVVFGLCRVTVETVGIR